jgi:hypothetical protein
VKPLIKIDVELGKKTKEPRYAQAEDADQQFESAIRPQGWGTAIDPPPDQDGAKGESAEEAR